MSSSAEETRFHCGCLVFCIRQSIFAFKFMRKAEIVKEVSKSTGIEATTVQAVV